MKVTYVHYKCSQCGETDTDKLFENESAAHAINCWNCHAGQGKEIPTMLATKVGMFPVK